VGECGLNHKEFWDLSWFEWSLYARRHRIRVQEIKAIDDGHWARFRIQWADFRNANKGKSDTPVEPEDLIKLPFDKEKKEEQKPLSFKQAKAKLGSKFKRDGGE
jgi:hypothetical protein